MALLISDIMKSGIRTAMTGKHIFQKLFESKLVIVRCEEGEIRHTKGLNFDSQTTWGQNSSPRKN
jgi:hypothetical protein